MEKLSARSSSYRARSSISWCDRRRIALLFILPLMALPLAGCGFSPLYAERNDVFVTGELAMLDVVAPEDDLGREIKFSLLDILSSSGNPPANPAYRVELAPRIYEEDVAIERDADVTRKNLVLIVPFRMIDMATKKPVLTATSRSRSSYNRVNSEFANITASQDARTRITKAAANDIKLQLSIYFDRRAKAGG
ncbi:MAG: hypothetical protein CVT73_06970 [Alphaproteobacteria bacterium HGW-Alphaproteobacteria-12]|nr:MAG: hypothetical protein CVT73_06970 [Alphaproteobacteria bacterium HGW-Alphaproteobacteria-12]